MRFGIELPFLVLGIPNWPARLTDEQMIQATIENKYSFNMQVSVKAMATPDRDHCDLKSKLCSHCGQSARAMATFQSVLVSGTVCGELCGAQQAFAAV
jgi:hypothetical protein